MSDGAHIVWESPYTPLSIKLPYDASLTGAVISHLMEDQSEKFIAFASKFLALAKWSCMEIEKGSLSYSWQFKTFHQCYIGNDLCWLMIINCTFSTTSDFFGVAGTQNRPLQSRYWVCHWGAKLWTLSELGCWLVARFLLVLFLIPIDTGILERTRVVGGFLGYFFLL